MKPDRTVNFAIAGRAESVEDVHFVSITLCIIYFSLLFAELAPLLNVDYNVYVCLAFTRRDTFVRIV